MASTVDYTKGGLVACLSGDGEHAPRRRCNRCGAIKPLADFHRDRSGRDGFGYRCKPCNGRAVKEWATSNPERARENGAARQRRWRERNPGATAQRMAVLRACGRQFVDAMKEGVPCGICGGVFPGVAMDWHHRPDETKRFTIGASTNRSVAELAAEIAKCDLLCSNCHRVTTANQSP